MNQKNIPNKFSNSGLLNFSFYFIDILDNCSIL